VKSVRPQVPQQRGHRARRRNAQRRELLAIFAPCVFRELSRKGGHERQHQQRLRDHDRGRREEDAHRAQRSRAREQEVNDEAHHDRRQPEQRVQHHHHRMPSRKVAHGDEGAERQANRACEERGCEADLEGENDDAPQFRIPARDEAYREREAREDVLHRSILSVPSGPGHMKPAS
jgi:hypothetical protein